MHHDQHLQLKAVVTVHISVLDLVQVHFNFGQVSVQFLSISNLHLVHKNFSLGQFFHSVQVQFQSNFNPVLVKFSIQFQSDFSPAPVQFQCSFSQFQLNYSTFLVQLQSSFNPVTVQFQSSFSTLPILVLVQFYNSFNLVLVQRQRDKKGKEKREK